MSNYELNVISHHKDFSGKTLKKYHVGGIDHIGAYGDENFSVQFKNNTGNKVQVVLSLDGTNILSGKPATTEVSNDMWVVNAYGSLTLQAWPEDNNGGARFVFTSADNSVAIHTHGDLSSRGIIAAAVFVEGAPTSPFVINNPIRVIEKHHHHHPFTYPSYPYDPYWINNVYTSNNSKSILRNNTAIPSSSVMFNNCGDDFGASGDSNPYLGTADAGAGGGLEELVSVGAGQYTEQAITYVQGLIKPVFTETVRVKFVWWDALKDMLRTQTAAQEQPSGFPGDKNKKNIDLKRTPRMGKRVLRAEQPQVFDRV